MKLMLPCVFSVSFFKNLSLHSEGSLHHARRGDKDKERIVFEGRAEDERGTEDERRFPEM